MNLRIVALTCAALVVAACGDSKKEEPAGRNVAYSGPTGSAPIANADAVQSSAASAYQSVQSLSSSFGSFSGLAGVTGSVPTFTAKEALRRAAKYRASLPAASAPGVTVTATDTCAVSGSVSVVGSVADDTGATTAVGDFLQVTFRMCEDVPGEFADGSLRFEIKATDGADFLAEPPVMNTDVQYQVELTFSNLAFVDVDGFWFGMAGNIILSTTQHATSIEDSISGTSIAMAVGAGNQVLAGSMLVGPTPGSQYSQTYVEEYLNGLGSTITAAEAAFNGKLCSTEIQGCVTVVTSPPFRVTFTNGIEDPYPAAGSMTITSGIVQITITDQADANVQVVYDLNTLDAVPATTVNTTWGCLEADVCADF